MKNTSEHKKTEEKRSKKERIEDRKAEWKGDERGIIIFIIEDEDEDENEEDDKDN